jgi:hypothetical protein
MCMMNNDDEYMSSNCRGGRNRGVKRTKSCFAITPDKE